jgi:hypothetical protein
MNKKYTIVNSSLNPSEFCVDYFFYIIIIILVVYLVAQLINSNYKDNFSLGINENFDSSRPDSIKITAESTPVLGVKSTTEANLYPSLELQLQEARLQNDALVNTKKELEEAINKQKRAMFLAKNYYKIDDGSFGNQIEFINGNFSDIRLPESDFNNKTLITGMGDWNKMMEKTSQYKNLYSQGDIVLHPADNNISKDNICYKDYSSNLSSDPEFKKKYPECMVCSVNPESDYKNTPSWKNTKTNIHKVCLFNPNAPDDSTVLNYSGCKKLCGM